MRHQVCTHNEHAQQRYVNSPNPLASAVSYHLTNPPATCPCLPLLELRDAFATPPSSRILRQPCCLSHCSTASLQCPNRTHPAATDPARQLHKSIAPTAPTLPTPAVFAATIAAPAQPPHCPCTRTCLAVNDRVQGTRPHLQNSNCTSQPPLPHPLHSRHDLPLVLSQLHSTVTPSPADDVDHGEAVGWPPNIRQEPPPTPQRMPRDGRA
jgi:hypothetical protein